MSLLTQVEKDLNNAELRAITSSSLTVIIKFVLKRTASDLYNMNDEINQTEQSDAEPPEQATR